MRSAAGRGVARRARHLASLIRYTWRTARTAKDPRWQGKVIMPFVQWAARGQRLEFESLVRLELLARRLLGQPLSNRAWDRMTFTDKVVHRRLRVRDPILRQFSDKLAMREYVAERLGEDTLPALLAVAERAADLADRVGPFVLKANHGSGWVTFVGEGEVLSPEQLREADGWLAQDYAWADLEWSYIGARRLLLVEEFLHMGDRLEPPPDYKVFTFDGEPQMIALMTGRLVGVRERLLRPDWTPVHGKLDRKSAIGPAPAPPESLELMLSWAAELGRGLDFIRVDLYDMGGGRAKMGELTNCPSGGNIAFTPRRFDAWLGGLWRAFPVAAAPDF